MKVGVYLYKSLMIINEGLTKITSSHVMGSTLFNTLEVLLLTYSCGDVSKMSVLE